MPTFNLESLLSKGVRISRNHNGQSWGWFFEFNNSGETLFFEDEDAAPGAGGTYHDYPFTEEDVLKIRSFAK